MIYLSEYCIGRVEGEQEPGSVKDVVAQARKIPRKPLGFNCNILISVECYEPLYGVPELDHRELRHEDVWWGQMCILNINRN